MNISKRKLIVGVAAGAVIAIGALAVLENRGSDEPSIEEAVAGPDITLAQATPTPAPAAGDAKVEAARAAVLKAAEDFTRSYFTYSYQDASLHDLFERSSKYMTDGFRTSLAEAFDVDTANTVEWAEIENSKRIVVAEVLASEVDRFARSTSKRAVVAVSYRTKVQDANGTNNTGQEQTVKVVVVDEGAGPRVGAFHDSSGDAAA